MILVTAERSCSGGKLLLVSNATGLFTSLGPAAIAYRKRTPLALGGARVLFAPDFETPNSLIVDVATSTRTTGGSLALNRAGPLPVLATGGGGVWLLGGYNPSNGRDYVDVDRLDPSTGTFSTSVPMADARLRFSRTTSLSGDILVAGGQQSGLYLGV